MATKTRGTFQRRKSLAGTVSSVPEQQRRMYVGNRVKVPGPWGWETVDIKAISTDGHSFMGDDNKEYLRCEILL